MKYYERDELSADQARFAAQRIAFGPLVFHAALALRDLGLLEALMKAGDNGCEKDDLCAALGLSRYVVTVLLESGLGAQLLYLKNERFHLTRTGYFMLHDELTRVNMNFVRDICYAGATELVPSLLQQRPVGLSHLADSELIYDALEELPEPAKTSWFEFDHYYSDSAFQAALPHVFRNQPKALMDIGCNTGKFALLCAGHSKEVALTLVDSPPIVERALINLSSAGFAERVQAHGTNLLSHQNPLPTQQDAVWMSQLLSCFSEEDVVELLRRAAASLRPGGEVFVLETFWDRQSHPGGAFSLLQTSLYFTTMANGKSRVYDSKTLEQCAARAGLMLVECVEGLGLSHTLLRLQPHPST